MECISLWFLFFSMCTESCVWKEDDLRDFFMMPFQGGFVDNVQYVNFVSEHYTGNAVGVYCAYLLVCQDVF